MRIREKIQAVLWKNYTPLKGASVTPQSLCESFSPHSKVNIFNLAKNAGTSVDQIERFYARNLPLSRGMAINLQSFDDGDVR